MSRSRCKRCSLAPRPGDPPIPRASCWARCVATGALERCFAALLAAALTPPPCCSSPCGSPPSLTGEACPGVVAGAAAGLAVVAGAAAGLAVVAAAGAAAGSAAWRGVLPTPPAPPGASTACT
eukprot:7379921-Prymnesium_polylepis.2